MAGLERGCGEGKNRSFVKFYKKATKFGYFCLEIHGYMCPGWGVWYHQAAKEEVFAFILMKGRMFQLSDYLERILSPGKPENTTVLWMPARPNRNKQQIKWVLSPLFHLFG